MHPRLAQLALTAALAGAITLSAWAEGPARLLGAFALDGPDPMLGGLSAIEVTDGGRGIVLLSDRGALFRGTVARGGSGEVTGVALAPAALLMARSASRKLSNMIHLSASVDGDASITRTDAGRILSVAVHG